MTKCARVGSTVKVGCFPDEKLIDALTKVLRETDGVPVDIKVVGKARTPGELERPVSKFHGREVEVITDRATVRILITES